MYCHLFPRNPDLPQAKRRSPRETIPYICDFSRCRLNVRLTAYIQPLLRGHKYRVWSLFGGVFLPTANQKLIPSFSLLSLITFSNSLSVIAVTRPVSYSLSTHFFTSSTRGLFLSTALSPFRR